MNSKNLSNKEDCINKTDNNYSPCSNCMKLSCKGCEYRDYTNTNNTTVFKNCYFRPDEFISFESYIPN